MRISSLQVYNIANNSMARANEELMHTQEQISTGKRVITPADDPVATSKILQLDSEIKRIDQYQQNVDIAQNGLDLQEATLNNVLDVLQRVQELSVQAGNTSVYTQSEYTAIAAELDSRLDELYSLMNSKNPAGDYMFAGFKGDTEPFQGNARVGFSYHGDLGQQLVRVADNTNVAVSDSGKAIFMDIPAATNTVTTFAAEGNKSNPPLEVSPARVVDQEAYDEFFPQDMVITFDTNTEFTVKSKQTGEVIASGVPYHTGEEIEFNGVKFTLSGAPAIGDKVVLEASTRQDLLTTFANFAGALRSVEDTPESKQEMAKVVADTLKNLDNAQTRILQKVTEMGARQNTLDTTREFHLDTELVSQETLSQLRDVDFAEASTRLTMQSMILQAAQASFLKISGLTLFSRM